MSYCNDQDNEQEKGRAARLASASAVSGLLSSSSSSVVLVLGCFRLLWMTRVPAGRRPA